MNEADLADLVSEIAEAVAAAGYQDRSDWLQKRSAVLRARDSESCARAKVELAGVVPGMGGLIDIYYGADWKRMQELIDRLWVAVKDR